jgi:pyruvate/2-oxoglutarate dehydrogenase complex dihydrolipoamide acyltransferase (E2) component
MRTGAGDVTVVRFPRERAMMREWLTVAASRHTIHGLVDLDVTEPRRLLGDRSFTAYLIHCFATALVGEPRLNVARRGRRLYRFQTVHIGTMVEAQGGLAGVVIREADRKAVDDIHREIRSAQSQSAADLAAAAGFKAFFLLPGFVRRTALRFLLARPVWAHDRGLVTGVTAVGMFGSGAGWGIPVSVGAAGTTSLTVGGIGRRPVLVDGRLEEHEYVCLTLSFDHDLIDGAPATRFAAELSRLIEAGDGLSPLPIPSTRVSRMDGC